MSRFHFQPKDFKRILSLSSNPPKVYIETGTWRGEQLCLAAPHFERVIGIELDYHWTTASAQAVKDYPHAFVRQGDTRYWLPVYLDMYCYWPVFAFLDAHFCQTDPAIEKSEFPLWDELTLFRDHRTQPDIISVDDVHTFGKERPDLRYTKNAVEWEGVTTESILEFFGDRVERSEIIRDGFVLWLKGEEE